MFPRRCLPRLLPLVTPLVAAAPAALGQAQVARLTAFDAEPSDFFGGSLGVSGETLVVGSEGDDDMGVESGSAYLFERDEGGPNAWGLVTKLVPADGAAFDLFGCVVAIDGDTIVVGAQGDDDFGSFSGSVYVFERDEDGPGAWGSSAKLRASDAFGGDLFGTSVAIDGDTIVVGARNAALGAGAAYVFLRDEGGLDPWVEVAKLVSSDLEEGDNFGRSVDVDGGTIVVGAIGEDEGGSEAGAAYVFQRDLGGPDAWGEAQRLKSDTPQESDLFGVSVAVSGNIVVVGASQEFTGRNGEVFLYQRDLGGPDAWGMLTRIITADGQPADLFGRAVALEGDLLAIGAPNDDDSGNASGTSFLYRQNPSIDADWIRIARFAPFQGAALDSFGAAVSVDVGFVAVGARRVAGQSFDEGAAYVFANDALLLNELLADDCNGNGVSDLVDMFLYQTAEDCNDNGLPDSCDIASGFSADEDGDGVPDECGGSTGGGIGPACDADIDGSGVVDLDDLNALLFQWGELCQPPVAPPADR